MADKKTKREEGVLTKDKPKIKRPPLYKVLLHNDDYTPQEFVVIILQKIFRLNEVDATKIMLHVHHSGVGIAGTYTYEIAETKMNQTLETSRRYEFPLQCSMEPA